MISSFFIERPIFASVISILITLVGLAALLSLPVEQYPNITPPQIQVSTVYNGADAQTVSDTVAAPIEQQVNGTENMIYMYSQNSASGNMVLSVFFGIGTPIEQAQIDVQNQVNLAMPQLPQEVQVQGVNIQKQTPSILQIIALQSPAGQYDDIFMSNYATINVVNELQLLPGISQISIINARNYAMRVWLRPDLMAQLGITTEDIVSAIKVQNANYPVGQIGQPPTDGPVQLTIPVSIQGRLTDPKEFDNIIIRAESNGAIVRIKDVGYTELGAQNYNVVGDINGESTIIIAIYQQYGANALSVAESVRQTMKELSKDFPSGIEYFIPYDTTKFVIASITEVFRTMIEAAILVVLVVFIFLQSVRATLIPIQALIVSIVGTFAGMYMLGLSLNTLTLFGMVLAIGIVVDDAIVVIENVERNMRELGLSPKEAAHKAMEEVTGPVIAIVFVLCAVFVPVAFLGGIAGQLYKQFALTISISVIFSGIVALTSSPALAAVVLKKDHQPSKMANLFNHYFGKLTDFFIGGASWFIKRIWLGFILFAIVCGIDIYLFRNIPGAFVPNEDQGYLFVIATLPEGASLDRVNDISRRIEKIALSNPAVEYVITMGGFSYTENVNRPNVGTYFVILKDWSQRKEKTMQADYVRQVIGKELLGIQDAYVLTFNPPAIQGLGTVGGFEFWIENRGPGDIAYLEQITREVIAESRKHPQVANLSTTIQANTKLVYVDLDRDKAKALGIPLNDIFNALQVQFGSLYVNQFNKYGRTYQVLAQAAPRYRGTLDNIGEIYVKASNQQMVPLNSVVRLQNKSGPSLVSRFNAFPASKITGGSAPGYSSGESLNTMMEIAKKVLPQQMHYAWSGEAYQQIQTGGTSFQVLLAGMIVVFLILAALYERWLLPVSILMAVPFGMLGALLAIWLRGMSNDVYFQIGLVTLVALSAKNAILIVEFAIIKHREGMNFIDAAIEASKLRFRAILMTSLTFIFGVIPLVTSSGPGANSRHSVGTGVLGGMIAATLLAIFFVPLFYRALEEFSSRRKKSHDDVKTSEIHSGG